MSSGYSTQLDHAERGLSTAAPSPSEPDNALRYRPGAGGHVESHFLKANSPEGGRAIWLKHTLLVPVAGPPVAELWAIAFAERGRQKRALKQSYPLAEASWSSTPFAVRVPGAELRHGAASGQLGSAGERIRWDLCFDVSAPSFRPFPHDGMYRGPFPRSKTLTPAPDTRVSGRVEAFGETWELASWRGAQGHNWGKSHAEAYGWVHANALTRSGGGPVLEQTWLEALSGRVRIGPLVTPYLSVAGFSLEGRLFRFDGPRALLSRQVAIDGRSYRFSLRQGGATLSVELGAEPAQFAGLRYEDPDGRSLSCLNCKLARARVTFSYEGLREQLVTDQAALELGTRRGDHGVPILV